MSPPSSKTRFLLDTNIVLDVVRNPQGRVASWIAVVGEDRVCASIIMAAELRYGAAKKGSARLASQLAAVIGAMEVLPFEAPADVAYGALRAELEAKGRLIGPNDMLIAAQVRTLGYVLVTNNEGEFRRVPNLRVENWLR